MNRLEYILQCISEGKPVAFIPKSKLEAYLLAMANKTGVVGLPQPKSKMEELLYGIAMGTGQGGSNTSDATATADDILLGKTAYVDGVKVEGTIEEYDGSFEGGADDLNTLKKLLDNTKKADYLFNEYKLNNVSDLIKYNDTENVETIRQMFNTCTADTIPIINTKNVKDFTGAYLYTTVLLIKLDTSNAVNITSLCASNRRLRKLDISFYNFSDVSKVSSFLNNCNSIKALIIRNFGENYVLNTNSFNNCYHILGKVNSTYNPTGAKDGYIYVPRNMIETLSSATNWSTYASQLRALEDYTVDGTTTGEFDDEKAGLL